ncbi:MAG TPA: murein biosynthesis integral membrane protein MurJ [Myxococcaceae bacterium]|nr:murein biosynthesis integral membrane protein MurJ [Myxococcaceae bacterium]
MPASTEEAAVPETRARGAADASGRGALLVGAGILLSRILGLVRERVFAHYFGSSAAAAAFRAAQRIPNFLQNLLGEGVLSASFIPVYAELLAVGNEEEADRLAGIIFGMLALTTSLLVAVGVMFTPALLSTVASGFQGESRELALVLLRIAFPGTGLLVMCAWCLGILNSHRKFFLSYVAPVVWNVAQIATMLALGRGRELSSLAVWVTWATVAGALAQLLVQFPTALGLLGRFRPALSLMRVSARRVLRSFWPVVVARGVVQLSAYLDIEYTSLISNRAYAVLSAAQILYLLPVSLFGMSVSAAELPELSRERGTPEEVAQAVRARIDRGSARIAFFVVPSAAALLVLGDVVGGTLLRTGRFSPGDVRYLWYLLMGATIGLVASTQGRLYSSAFYAFKDTRTPLYFAAIRVALTAVLAYWSAVKLPGLVGIPREIGCVGITATTGLAAWLEFLLLRRTLGRRIGPSGISAGALLKLWAAAAVAAAAGLSIKMALVWWRGPVPGTELEWHGTVLPMPAMNAIAAGVLVLGVFGLLYFAITAAMGNAQSRATISRLVRRR